MKKGYRFLSIVLIAVLTFLMYRMPDKDAPVYENAAADKAETIYIWYTDEALTDYIGSAALSFYDDTGVRAVPVLYTGAEYLEEIYDASLHSQQIPDLYILGTESLEQAAMAGLAVPVSDENHILTSLKFPQIALDSVTYKGQRFGYPFYYETAFLLYNETYLNRMARKLLLEDAAASNDGNIIDAGEGEDVLGGQEGDMPEIKAQEEDDFTVPDGYSEAAWNDMMSLKLMEMIPHSIEDILEFAGSYDAPENVENIFLWDVNDIFYNYFFAGAYMDVGGRYGDDHTVIEIYNEETIECLSVYQELRQFFSIESEESSYDKVLEQFMQGKTIFTIATTDAISKLDNAAAEGTFPYSYNVAPLPGVDGGHRAAGLSVTDAVVISGYSNHKAQANAFAKYLVVDDTDTLLGRTGKMPATVGADDYVTDARDLSRQVYRESKALPKAIEFSNFWLLLEQAYYKVWNGEDANETLRLLSEEIKQQVDPAAAEQRIEAGQ